MRETLTAPVRPIIARRAIWWAFGIGVLFVLAWGFLQRSAWLGLWGLTNDLEGRSPFYAGDMPVITFVMYLHMITGALLILMAPLQLAGPLRKRWPKLHRHSGRVMIGLGLFTGAAGIAYATQHGTTGGRYMDVSTTLYGILILWSAAQTLRFGLKRSWTRHRRWGMRLSVLVVASWLYRMHYVVWEAAFGMLWITPDMTGPFDVVQAWGFYLFYLALLEAYFFFWEDRRRGARRVA